MKIGKALQKHRKEHGMTQEQLAKILNLSRQTISKWENDRGFPDIENLIWLCDIYKISLDELVGRKQISYTVKSLRKQNKRKDLLQMFPKYTGIVTSILALSMVLMIGLGMVTHERQTAALKEQDMMIVYSVVDDPIDPETGKYAYFELENGEKIEGSMKNIEEYELDGPVNKITPNFTDRSAVSRHISLSRLTDY